jgi:hypothetical protein
MPVGACVIRTAESVLLMHAGARRAKGVDAQIQD